jgi:hypothetical protein
MERSGDRNETQRNVERWIAAAVGLLLVGGAAMTLRAGGLSPEQWLEALVVAGLGLDTLVNAARNRRPLVLRGWPVH